MKQTLLDLLLQIPKDSTQAEIKGITMKIINPDEKKELLKTDPYARTIHECTLANGNFLFIIKNNKLEALYKVTSTD